MAFVLLQLKIAVQRHHRGKTAVTAAIALWGRWLVALILGLAAGAAVAFLDATGSFGDLAVLLIFTLVWIGWVIFPIAIPGMADTSVDPAKLEMYPITPIEQVTGFALGGLFAPTALFTFLTASGGSVIPDETVMARVLVVLAALVYAVSCITASRAVMALTAGAMRSRHGRDLVFVAAGAVTLGLVMLISVAEDFLSDLAALENSTLSTILEWTPPGAFGASVLSLREGDFGAALISIGYGLIWLVGFGALWTWAIRRRVRGGGNASQVRQRHTGDAELALLPQPMQTMQPTPAVAAAAQQLRYFFFRSPKATQQIVAGVVGAAFLGYQTVTSNGLAMGTAAFIPVMSVTLGMSTFNYDDRGFAYLMQTGANLRRILVGKVVINWLIVVLIMVLFVVVMAATTDAWSDVLPALMVGLGVASMATGVGAVVGVTAPMNQEHPGPGRGKLVFALLGGIAVVVGLLAAGIFVFRWLTGGEVTIVGGLAVVIVGLVAGFALLRLAGNRVERDPLAIANALTT